MVLILIIYGYLFKNRHSTVGGPHRSLNIGCTLLPPFVEFPSSNGIYAENKFSRYRLRNHLSSPLKRYYSNSTKSGQEIHNLLANEKILSFDNLDKELVVKTIRHATENMIGVYLIYNKLTGNFYIGSSYKNIFKRFTQHLIHLNTNKIVKNAVLKYGLESFKFLILEYSYEDPQKIQTSEDIKTEINKLLKIEENYISEYNPKYNILTKTSSSSDYKHREESRQKMRESYKSNPHRLEFISNLNKGKKLSEEVKNKLREIALKRPPMSEETKLKCATNNKPIRLYFYTIVNKEKVVDRSQFFVYNSMKELSIDIFCDRKTLNRAIKYHNGFIPTMKYITSIKAQKLCYIEFL